MSKLRMFRDDIKRSVGLFLAIVMVFSSVVSVPVKASETLKIIDTGRLIAMGYKPDEIHDWNEDGEPDCIDEGFVFQTCKTVIIDNAQGVGMSEDKEPVLNADLYVTINGTEYKVMEFSSNPLYSDEWDSIGIEYLDDSYYKANVAPVYYKTCYNETLGMDEVQPIDEYYDVNFYVLGDDRSGAVYSDYALNFGFSEEIVNFFVGAGMTDWETRYNFLMSDNLVGKYTMKYTLSDNEDNIAEYIQDNAVLVNYEAYGDNSDSYGPGIKIGIEAGYNRIENLIGYHEAADFSHIRMYRGDIYVDADKLYELGGVLKLPNVNNSGLYDINSVYINEEVLYNDGYSKNTMEIGYNVMDYVLPSLVATKEEAANKFIEILMGKTYVSEDFATDSDYSLYNSLYLDKIQNGMTIAFGDSFMEIVPSSYGDPAYIYKMGNLSFGEAYANRESDWDYFSAVSAPLPKYIMSEISFSEHEEFVQYIEDHRCYLGLLNTMFYSEDVVYNIVTDDGVVGIRLWQMIEILWEVSELMQDNDEIVDWSALEGYTYSYWDDDFCDWREVAFTDMKSIIPASDCENISGYESSGMSFAEISWNVDCEASEVVNLAIAVGVNPDDLIVYSTMEREEATTSEEFETAVKNIFGEETYEQLIEYICNEYVTYTTDVSIVENNDTQKDVSVDVYAETLDIPLTFFDTTQLGKDYRINQLWYAGNLSSYLLMDKYPNVDFLSSYIESEEVLMHGELTEVYWNRYLTGDSYNFIPIERLYSLKYGELYKAEFGTVKFAKIPAQIPAQTELPPTTHTEVELTWDVPADNGAEILGYQIAVVPHSNARSGEPAENQYITSGADAGSYTDIGDNYEILYTTPYNSYTVNTEGKSVDVYVRAVNVIGASQPQKFTIINPYDIGIVGATTVQAGSSSDYNVNDYSDTNVENMCTYSIQGNPEGVSIDANGVLTVDSECTLSEVVIVATGTGAYADRSSTLTVVIEPAGDEEPPTPPQEEENTSTPAQEEENTSTPAQEEENTSTPAQEEENTSTSAQEEENTSTPAQEEENTSTPAQEEENTSTPAQEEENTSTPAQEEENTSSENPTESSSEEPTESSSETPTESSSENPTEPSGETPTEPNEEDPTEPSGETPTRPNEENPTESSSEEPTESSSETPTEPSSENPTEPSGETPTRPSEDDSTEPSEEGTTEVGDEDPIGPSEEESEPDEITPPVSGPDVDEVPPLGSASRVIVVVFTAMASVSFVGMILFSKKRMN